MNKVGLESVFRSASCAGLCTFSKGALASQTLQDNLQDDGEIVEEKVIRQVPLNAPQTLRISLLMIPVKRMLSAC